MHDLLIHNGTLIQPGRSNRITENGAVLIREGLVAATGTLAKVAPRAKGIERLDAEGRIIMPGFINAHMHLYSTFARGMGPLPPAPQNFEQVLEQMWWPLDRTLDLQDVRLSAEYMLAEGLHAGVTTVIDHHESQGCQTGSLEELEKAALRVGVRAALCLGVSDRDGLAMEGLQESRRFCRRISRRNDGRIAALWGLHALFTVEPNTLQAVVACAAETKSGLHLHVSEDACDEELHKQRYGCSVLKRLDDAGGLTPKTIVVHGVHIPKSDIKRLARSGAALVHNPRSNMNNAVGVANIPALLEAGITVGVGTDGMSADPCEDARTTMLLQHHKQKNPSAFFAEAVDMLLLNNANIASRFFPRPIGQLKKGCVGDVILVDYDPPTRLKAANLAGHVLFGLSSAPVDTAVVGGAVVMKGGRVLSVNQKHLAAKARRQSAAFQKRFAALGKLV